MKVLKLIDEKLEEIFLVIILIAAVVIVAMQVVTRYIFKIPLPWSEEIARYLFLWLTWVGASYATKERKHVSIDLVYEKLPEREQILLLGRLQEMTAPLLGETKKRDQAEAASSGGRAG